MVFRPLQYVLIVLKNQNLSGFLPPELADLPFIKEIVLVRNYLYGTIPPEWGLTRLVNITLLGNRLSGQIPKEIGNISTLISLVLDINQLSGPLPPELGSLTSLQIMYLTSNNFTGEVPATFAKLTALREFRLGDNLLSGKAPDFIQNWMNLTLLMLQGSGLAGPIPPGISLLADLTDLRITDLKGTEASFPILVRMRLKTLILRNCNIVGQLPSYLGNMTTLKALDVSFNGLSGPIPASFSNLIKIDYMYVTGNSFNGSVPAWMLKSGDIDLSYNNFTLSNTTSVCKLHKPNIFSNPLISRTVGSATCLRDMCPTPTEYGSFGINCGGDSYNNGSFTFDSDTTTSAAAADFYVSPANWAWSSTGHYLDDGIPIDRYTVHDHLRETLGLDMDARISAISLTYYGFCLVNGRYNIDLYFAEIEFTNDSTYESLERRVFDVYIQGKLEIKDFNIAAEAGGTRKRIIKTFVSWVHNNTLEIRLQWAGKGTTAIPRRVVYGPLISAISVRNPDFVSHGLSTGAKIGIAISVVLLLSALAALLWWKWEFCIEKIRKKDELRNEDSEDYLVPGLPTKYSYESLVVATNNFADKLGEGGCGSVFKGVLSDGIRVAVKCLDGVGRVKDSFLAEVETIGSINHVNLVRLVGYCTDQSHRMLIYEFMRNGSLDKWIFSRGKNESVVWGVRKRIIMDICKALVYLHEECRQQIIHLDVKPQNILLDEDFNAKLADFGLARLMDRGRDIMVSNIMGTIGYIAPEWLGSKITEKVDAFSFGVVVLEIVCGRKNLDNSQSEENRHLLSLLKKKNEEHTVVDLVDRHSHDMIAHVEEAMEMIKLATWCLQSDTRKRPSMSAVLKALEGVIVVPDNLDYDFFRPPPAAEFTGSSLILDTPSTSSGLR